MIKNLLLTGALTCCAALTSNAQAIVFTSDELGEVNGMAPNGAYAAITDSENNIAYLWSRETNKMTNISVERGSKDIPAGQRVMGTTAMGVSNDGTVVGSILYASGLQKPAYYKDGEWHFLEMHLSALNTNEAVLISGDGKTIGGYQFINDPLAVNGGRYYPCHWFMNEEGDYEMHAYTDIDLPNHQGFYPTCMTPDGKVIGGTVYAGIDAQLAAYVKDGQLYMSGKVETRTEPWVFKGKYYCGIDEETGKQIWSADPNDPRIVLFTETYIDGIRDIGSQFYGSFSGADANGCLYGQRTVATNVDVEEGTGVTKLFGCMINTETGEWTDNAKYSLFAAGLNAGEYIFLSGDNMLVNGENASIMDTFKFTTTRTFVGFNKPSMDGKVFGGMCSEVNPASGENQYFPLIVQLEDGILSGVTEIMVGDGKDAVIIVSEGHIEVTGAEAVAVYDLGGRMVSDKASTDVAPGLYVVKAGKTVRKVIVK